MSAHTDTERLDFLATNLRWLRAEGRILASDGIPAAWHLTWSHRDEGDFRAWVDARIAEHRAAAERAPHTPAGAGEGA